MEHQNSTEDGPAPTPVPTAADASRLPASSESPDATPGPATQGAPGVVKPTLYTQESTDSGIDAGSSSEYDQENHGDHVIQAQLDDEFSDEG
jgi:hypothetical protein